MNKITLFQFTSSNGVSKKSKVVSSPSNRIDTEISASSSIGIRKKLMNEMD